jgi:hypothetical protein
MPTEVSLVAGASSLTASARRALRAARATEGIRLSEEGNAARVDRALDALDYAAGVLDAIVGHAPDPDANAPVWSRRPQGAAVAAGPVRHEAEELHASLMALARTRAPAR